MALTLAQLALTLESARTTLWTTVLSLTPFGDDGASPCEIDFAVLAHDRSGAPQIAIGEAKANGAITGADVTNLPRVAAALESIGVSVYVVFAKTGAFSANEVARCMSLQSPGGAPRVLLWTESELVPYQPVAAQRKRARGAGIGPNTLAYYAHVTALSTASVVSSTRDGDNQ